MAYNSGHPNPGDTHLFLWELCRVNPLITGFFSPIEQWERRVVETACPVLSHGSHEILVGLVRDPSSGII